MTVGSVSEFLGAYKAPRLTTHVTARADLLGEITELAHDIETAKAGNASIAPPPEIAEKTERLDELIDEMRASEMAFTFEAVSNAELERIKATCPPTPSQAEKGLQWNPETYCPALVARCAVEPKVDISEAVQLSETLTESQFLKLWQTAAAVNIGADDAPKRVTPSVSAGQPETSSVTPLNGESLAASSSDG